MTHLKNMMIEITNVCNQSCPICEASIGRREKTIMPIELGLNIIKGLIDEGVTSISFTGGEPTLCWDNLIKFLKFCKEQNILTRLYTNGITLNKKKIIILENCLDDIVMSFDSLNPYITKKLRGTDKYLSKSLKNIRLLSESNIRLFIISVCSNINYKNLLDLADELENYNIDGWWIQQFIPKGIGEENSKIFSISDINWLKKNPQYEDAIIVKNNGDKVIEPYAGAPHFVMDPNNKRWFDRCFETVNYLLDLELDYLEIDQFTYQRNQ